MPAIQLNAIPASRQYHLGKLCSSIRQPLRNQQVGWSKQAEASNLSQVHLM